MFENETAPDEEKTRRNQGWRKKVDWIEKNGRYWPMEEPRCEAAETIKRTQRRVGKPNSFVKETASH